MRPLIISALLSLLFTGGALAQEHETLFGSDLDHGGFGGVVTKLTPIRGEAGVLVGGYGGWLIDHRLMLGLGGYGLSNQVRASADAEAIYAPADEPLYIEFGYGGFMIEYVIAPSRLLHVNVQALIGGGSVTYREDWHDDFLDDNPNTRRYGRREALFVAEPTVNAELNVTTWMRISAGVGYRFVTGVDELRGLENTDLSGLSGTLALKFGGF